MPVLCVKCMFNFSRNFQTVFHDGGTVLLSHHQGRGVPVAPLRQPYLDVLFMSAVLRGVLCFAQRVLSKGVT